MGKNVLVFLLLLVYQLYTIVASQFTFANKFCTDTGQNYTRGSVYESNLGLVLSNLTIKSSSLNFYNYTVGNASNKVYGIFQCRNDVNFEVCSGCVKDATNMITGLCQLYGEAIVWYYECMLRYANRNIFSLPEVAPSAKLWSLDHVTNYAKFSVILANDINYVTDKAAFVTPHFAFRKTNMTLFRKIYTFAECTPDVDSSGCLKCLETVLSEMIICCNASVNAVIFTPSCQIRYDTVNPFIDDHWSSSAPPRSSPLRPPPPPLAIDIGVAKKRISTQILVLLVAAPIVFLAAVCWLCIYVRKYNAKKIERDIGDQEFSVESLQHDFATLVTATNNFSDENKLGEGGFGAVYKGKLPNGKLIAVKRLSENSRQGMQEFQTEVSIIANLQHRNLVRLLGFCYTREEKLLVYEYVANKSLDNFLFDDNNRRQLSWKKRYKIIRGIARGLLYLHHDSQLKIIHRDIKASNVLLDAQMNPKICDFGTSKISGVDNHNQSTRTTTVAQIHNTDRVIGTLGYMAPEYRLEGEYSIKLDAYSFGVLILEIISGRRNQSTFDLPGGIEYFQTHAWNRWEAGTPLDFVDPFIRESSFNTSEAVRCFHLGLLCIQKSTGDRPTMADVVRTLDSNLVTDLRVPEPPALYSANEAESSSKSRLLTVNDASITELEPR